MSTATLLSLGFATQRCSLVSSNSPNSEQICDQKNGGVQALPSEFATIQADLKSLESLPNAIKMYAGVLVFDAICVGAVVPFLFQRNFQSFLIWLDRTYCVTALNWITAHIGFTNTIAFLRAHVGVDVVTAAIAIAVICAALGLAFVAGLNVMVANLIRNRKHFGFALWLSYLNCLFVPFGTIAGARALSILRRPANIAAFMLRGQDAESQNDSEHVDSSNHLKDLNCDEMARLHEKLSKSALVEIIRMPQPFHIGLVLSYFDGEHHKNQRTVWINGWFGVSLPVSIKATITRQSPYFLPFFPTSGPYIIDKSVAERMERMARSVASHLDENLTPYSFVPGIFDGPPMLTAPGGHTSNSIVASVLHHSEVVDEIAKQHTIAPWLFAPGANPHAQRNIMPREWFERM
jgi:hypothetical protein